MAYSYLSLLVIASSAVTGLLAEALCWLLIYRTSSYKRLVLEIEKANKKADEAAAAQPMGARNKKTKQEQRKDDLMKAYSAEIFKIQMKTTFIV